MSRSRVYQLRTDFLQGRDSFEPTASGGDRHRKWPTKAKAFLEDFLPLQNPPNYQLVTDELERLCGLVRARSSVEAYVKAHYAHLVPPRARKPRIYRRFRRAHIGELWQHDSSIHQWWPASSKQTLLLTTDDHSGLNLAGRFVTSDTTWNHFEHFREAFGKWGLPEIVYTDGLSLFGPSSSNDYSDPVSEFQRAFRGLGVAHRVAPTPQAKGKIERRFGTFQRRLVTLLAHERACYQDNWVVDYVDATPGAEHVAFTNGRALNLGQEIGGMRDDVWRVQIENTVRKHLEKELQVQGKGLKVLTLFFIDKVANYRGYDEDGKPTPGKFAEEFESAFRKLIVQDRYRNLPAAALPLELLHNGYFAQDKKGVLKDTNGTTQADDDVYSLIMQKKEQLLSLDEPLRFIFSHSALREGWDNPNVFQICTLNETRSATKKRQEIGRGLRLPVNQNGERVFDENINKLLVVANESYDDFARSLQTEYEEDCGVTFGKVPKLAFSKLVTLDGEVEKPVGREQSEAIWKGLIERGFLDQAGKILPKFNPQAPGFDLGLPAEHAELKSDIIETLQSYQMERHVKPDEEGKKLRFKKEVTLDPEFQELWSRIKPKTTFSVEYSTEELVSRSVKAIKEMEGIKPAKVRYTETQAELGRGGIEGTVIRDRMRMTPPLVTRGKAREAFGR